MLYTDFGFYNNVYLGQLIQEYYDFIQIARVVCDKARYMTMRKIDRVQVSEDIQAAICAACDSVYQYRDKVSKSGGSEIKSENNDGYSVSYVTDGADGKSQAEAEGTIIYDTLYPCLLTEGLMSRRVSNANECGHYSL